MRSHHVDVDMVQLCVSLYLGDIDEDLNKLNVVWLLKRKGFKLVTPREWLVFWGLVVGSAQYHARGWELGERSFPRNQRPAKLFFVIMHWRIQEIRRLLSYSKADMSRVVTYPWAWFRPVVDDFNAKRREVMQRGLILVLDESMSANRPCKDKTGGLPNLSFIARKPKPLGTKFKSVADAATGVVLHLEIQECKDSIRAKKHSFELEVTVACIVRLGEAAGSA